MLDGVHHFDEFHQHERKTEREDDGPEHNLGVFPLLPILLLPEKQSAQKQVDVHGIHLYTSHGQGQYFQAIETCF
jgi:hypothetical protein